MSDQVDLLTENSWDAEREDRVFARTPVGRVAAATMWAAGAVESLPISTSITGVSVNESVVSGRREFTIWFYVTGKADAARVAEVLAGHPVEESLGSFVFFVAPAGVKYQVFVDPQPTRADRIAKARADLAELEAEVAS